MMDARTDSGSPDQAALTRARSGTVSVEPPTTVLGWGVIWGVFWVRFDGVPVRVLARCGDDCPEVDGAETTAIRDLCASVRAGACACVNAPRRTRTFNPLIKSRVLYGVVSGF